MQGTTFLSFSSVSFGISFEHAVQLPFTVFLYSPFPDNYAFLSLSPSQIKNIQSADTVPVHGHSPLVYSSFQQKVLVSVSTITKNCRQNPAHVYKSPLQIHSRSSVYKQSPCPSDVWLLSVGTLTKTMCPYMSSHHWKKIPFDSMNGYAKLDVPETIGRGRVNTHTSVVFTLRQTSLRGGRHGKCPLEVQ